jgi:hypothetical protein
MTRSPGDMLRAKRLNVSALDQVRLTARGQVRAM